MEQWKFGDHLRHARERSGMSLIQAAQRLRIQPEILQAIERSDVRNMPPRAYARNMVAAYAKMLGLNPDEFCNMYLNEIDRTNQRVNRVQDRLDASSQRTSSLNRDDRAEHYPYRDSSSPYRTGRIEPNRDSRISHESADDYRISSYAGRRSSQSSRRSSDSSNRRYRDRTSDRFDDVDREQESYHDEPSRRSSRNERDDERVSNPVFNALSSAADSVKGFIDSRRDNEVYAGKTEGNDRKRILIIGAAVIIVLLLLIMVVSRSCSSSNSLNTMAVTAVEEKAEAAADAPTSFKFEYSIDEGYEPWVEIYIDDVQEVAETMTGPTSGSYDVTGTIEFCSATTEGIHIKIDGVEQTLEIDETQGILDAQYDFKEILAKWETDHGVKSSAKNDTSTQSSSSSSSSSSSDSSTGSESTSSDSSSTESSTPTGEQAVNDTTYDYSQDYTYQEPVYYDDSTATTGGY